MESDQQKSKKDPKVEIPSETEMITGAGVESHPVPASRQVGSASGLSRQPSVTKSNCMCSPTTHAGSFRCRIHRAPSSLQGTKSIESPPASLQDSTSKPNSFSAAAE